MKILLLGPNGLLGRSVAKYFQEKKYDFISLDHNFLDLTDRNAVFSLLDTLDFDYIFNSVAYTDVNGAETNVDLAYAVNEGTVKNIIDYLKQSGRDRTQFIHISTDYVFSGDNLDAYDEDSIDFHPVTIYGQSKLAGELYLRENYKNYYLLRISSLFGPYSRNFVHTIFNLAKRKDELAVVADQYSCPTYTEDFLLALGNILDNKLENSVYHIINSVDDVVRGISWYEFAEDIVSFLDKKPVLKKTTLKEFFPNLVKPKRTVLLNTKLEKLAHYKDALFRYYNDFLKNE